MVEDTDTDSGGVKIQVSRENAIIGGLIVTLMAVGVLGVVTVQVGEATGLLTLGGQSAGISAALMDTDDFGDRPVLGDMDAPVTIVVYEDFFCQFCARFNQDVFPQLKEDYIKSGDVRYVFRHFVAAGGGAPAMAAECVREQNEDAFWDFHDMHYQDGLDELGNLNPGRYEEELVDWVEAYGLDVDRFETCYTEEEPRDWIEEETTNARVLGASGTPTIVVNGEVIQGAQPYDVFQQVIENHLSS